MQEIFSYEIKGLCRENSITYRDRKDNYQNTSDFSLAVGWRWLIHDVKNLIVFHDSLLPRYRGFSPIVNMLIKGEKFLGATAILHFRKWIRER